MSAFARRKVNIGRNKKSTLGRENLGDDDDDDDDTDKYVQCCEAEVSRKARYSSLLTHNANI